MSTTGRYGRIIAGCLWLLAGAAPSEPTGLISYQGRLLDQYGRRVNTPVTMEFRILTAQDELLWSETQSDLPVTDGMYATMLGSLTPLPASLFNRDDLYFELCINGEPLTPRQRITAAPFALTARVVNGPVVATSFQMPAGASAGYVLTCDDQGVGQWQPGSRTITETDPIHENWVNTVFDPAFSNLWAAVDARVLAATYNVATGNLWTALGQRVLVADYAAATGQLWTAINARLPASGGLMTGALSNQVGFFGRFSGDGGGLTNLSSAGFTDTGAVHKTGGTMTGPLIVSNNLAVSGQATYRPGTQTIADNSTTIQVAQTFARIGTAGGALRDFSGCELQIAPGQPGQTLVLQAVEGAIRLRDGQGVKLAGGVSFTMGANDTLQLIYDGANWIELQRVDSD